MANVFLDSNFLFDLTERDVEKRQMMGGHKVFMSALSYHILFYTYRYKVPQKNIKEYKKQFTVVNFTNDILNRALEGPTKDLEDNIQLHSAVKSDSDYFMTNDKRILKMKFFGKMKITSTL